jgi:outer membrane receptor protein involved in Fe transport
MRRTVNGAAAMFSPWRAGLGAAPARRPGRRTAALVAAALTMLLALAATADAATQRSDSDEDLLESAFGDAALISLATGDRQTVRRAPAVATVITAADIEAMGARDLSEALAAVPGLHVGATHIDYAPHFIFRGIQSDFNPQTLLLLDGVPMTTLFIGNRGLYWGGFPLHDIARIEIVRGPASALHGADAFAGVINLVTRSAASLQGDRLGAGGASFGTWEAWWQHGQRVGPVQAAFSVRVGRTDGHRRTIERDAQTALDAVFGTRASLAPGPVQLGHETADARLELAHGRWRFQTLAVLRDQVQTGAGVSAALDPVGRGRSQRVVSSLGLADQPLAEHWQLSLALSWQTYSQYHRRPVQLFPPGAFGGLFPQGMVGAPNTWERQARVAATLAYSGWTGHRWRLGVGADHLDLHRTQEFKNFAVAADGPAAGVPVPLGDGRVVEMPVADSFLAPHRRRVAYAWLQDEWDFAKDWTLTGGLRRDHFSDAGSTTNPRLGLVWNASLDLTAKLLYGHAFRAPSFNELHSINSPVARGNPRLRPETIRTLEASLAWDADPRLHAQLSVYRYRMRDVIRSVADGGVSVGRSFQNVGVQTGRGAEAEFRWRPTRQLSVSGHLAWQRATDELTGQPAADAPRRRAWLHADWRLPGDWQLGTQLHHAGDRRRAAGDPRPPVADATTADLHLRSPRFDDGWQVTASVANLTNADVREPTLAGVNLPDDLPMAPRTMRLTLQATF